MALTVESYLRQAGPSRAGTVAAALQAGGVSAANARQKLSRARHPVLRFPVPLLPKREAFFYLEDQRRTDRFWHAFLRDLREAGSVYAAALDGLAARGGLIPADHFEIISGAPASPRRGQVAADLVLRRLVDSWAVEQLSLENDGLIVRFREPLEVVGRAPLRARRLAEGVLLDALREWGRNLGLASYHRLSVRGEGDHRAIGAYAFDLSGPSYLLPLAGGAGRPGFLAADVFAEGVLDENNIAYFIRKARALKASLAGVGVLSILVAPAFTGAALTAGHKAGVIVATPTALFGRRVGVGLMTLLETLSNAAAYASSSPKRLVKLLESLSDIEGRGGNLRGVLFELIVGHLVRQDAVSIDMGVVATDPATGRKVDIDVQKVMHQSRAVSAIECKGKVPGGVVSVDEVDAWLAKLPTVRAHFKAHAQLSEAQLQYELWTSGRFSDEALARLQSAKQAHTRVTLAWVDGDAVLAISTGGREKTMSDALKQHFFRHPLAEARLDADAVAPPDVIVAGAEGYAGFVASAMGTQPKEKAALIGGTRALVSWKGGS